ncbi:hypothetical protein Nepgr_028676 [Nepenthes gracilis]|uniref:H15 domain-containing protein n=1 Tax=Nepenthes gracilis TaxID=150966 RepID=A0AAD3Y2M2_NEPGR|nr:hypothetical protein Nepgr_028676 [Nepenthes gracilis]
MAAEEVCKPPSFPSYAEMIYSALDALNEENGSNKTTISKYIESKYPFLPSSHSALLKHHLSKMKDSGELIFWKNNYRKPDPNFIRRGRGRPPKTENLRNRPGPSAPTTRQKNQQVPSLGSGRPRGRPRKTPRPAFYGSNPEQDLGFPVLLKGHGSPRPRGRPPKVKSSQMGGDIGPNEQ